MKTLYIFLLLVINNIVFAQQPQGIITYEIVLGDDPRALMREVDTQRLRNAQKLAQELSFNLYFTGSESYFEINELPIDTKYFSNLFVESSTQPEYSVYCNLNQEEYSYNFFNKFKSQTYLLKDKANYKWNITNESKIINNITVYKAIGKTLENEKIEAWFAPEIPVSAGPEIYMGLPGLILEMQIGYTKYVTKKIEFTENYIKNIKKISEGKPINQTDYLKILEEETGFYGGN